MRCSRASITFSTSALLTRRCDRANATPATATIETIAIVKSFVKEEAERRDILINAVCPGLVDTAASRPWFADMTSAQSPDQAAVDVVWLATLPAGTTAPYSELIRHRQTIPFEG